MVSKFQRSSRNFAPAFAALFVLHAVLLFFDYGRLPAAPVLGDEVIINDPSISLSLGHGFRAESLAGSHIAIDKFYGHFPPIYQLLEALSFRIFGISVYSLRLTSALADLACMAALLAGLAALVRWRLADRATILPIAVFATLNAVYITMNRIARPDSTVGFFGILGLIGIVGALYRDTTNDPATNVLRSEQSLAPARLAPARFGLLLLGTLSIGLSFATHLEAMLLGTFAVCAILLAASASWWQKLAACAVIPVTFVAAWCATLGHNALAGWRQMHDITYLDMKIGPGLGRQWQILTADFTVRVSGPFVLLFLEAVLLLCAVPLLTFWLRRSLHSGGNRDRLAIALSLACVLNLVLLQFVLPNSPRRFGMMLPVLLYCLAIVLPPLQLAGRRIFAAASALFALASVAMLALYFRSDRNHPARFDPRRYDAIVDHIAAMLPPGARIASSRNLWLAFRERGVPVTIFYEPGFDGLSPFRNLGRDSLDAFNTVVLLDVVEDDQAFRPEAMQGRKLTTYPVDGQVVQVYQKLP